MKTVFITLMINLSVHLAFAQTINFEKFYGGAEDDYGYDIVQTENGDFIIVGNSYSMRTPESSNPTYVIRTNSRGEIQWEKIFGLASNNTLSRRILQKDGKYFISGYGDGGYGIFLMELDQNGDSIWTKKYFEGNNTSTGGGLLAFEDGFLLTGHIFGPSAIQGGVLIKTSLDGDTLWTKIYPSFMFQSSLIQSGDNNFIAATSFNDIEDYGIVKINSSGDTLWTKRYFSDLNTRINSVIPSNDGGFVITGGYYTTNWSDGFIIKVDSDGNEMWSKTFDIDKTNDHINSIIAIQDGYVFTNDIIVNSTTTFIRMTHIDELGSIKWSTDFDCLNSLSTSLKSNLDKGFSIIGSVRETTTSNYADIYHIKADSLGKILYYAEDTIKICQGESIEIGGQQVNMSGTYYDIFQTIHNCDSIVSKFLKVNPLPTVSFELPIDTVCSNDLPFNLIGGSPIGGTYSFLDEESNSLNPAQLPTGNLTITYSFDDENNCAGEAFDELVIENCTITGLPNKVNNAIKIFPNPTEGSLTVELNYSDVNYPDELHVLNSIGRIILIIDPRTTRQLTLHNTGIFFIQLLKEGRITGTRKIIKN